MFSFFKKKTKPAETPRIETPAPLAPEQAPAAPETIAPVPEPQREPVAAPSRKQPSPLLRPPLRPSLTSPCP
ncbi:Uncharacterised protein [Chromobacterium violaceum]|uniref:Uncharacterized protein n=1 Tax=Chromobacterium violaceum TaxID=536 RepID=A0A3S4J5D5_CHRVL|nr:Uncharacterised protein [Chromobacterium violaceum]